MFSMLVNGRNCALVQAAKTADYYYTEPILKATGWVPKKRKFLKKKFTRK